MSHRVNQKQAQPSEQDFRPIVLHRKVVFEGLRETKPEPRNHRVGFVRVANRAFEKRVYVRYTRNNWESFLEVEAYWVETVEERTDKFIFVIPFPTDWTGTIEFAIRYEVRGVQYWDNNEGDNYKFSTNSRNSHE